MANNDVEDGKSQLIAMAQSMTDEVLTMKDEDIPMRLMELMMKGFEVYGPAFMEYDGVDEMMTLAKSRTNWSLRESMSWRSMGLEDSLQSLVTWII